jgi:histidinol-phosphate aminotransferase
MYFRPNIESLSPYVPGIQPQEPGFVKLNTNENPYPPSPRVAEVLRAISPADLRLYPDPVSDRLRDAVASLHGLSRSHVLVGDGSDEILSMIFRAMVGKGDRVVLYYPSYTLFRVLAEIQEAETVVYDLEEDFSLPEKFIRARAALKLIASPNSPTGTPYSLEAIDRALEATEGIVVVDEAYVDFAAGDSIPLLAKYPNLIVTRTVSKSYSLAGVRIGYALAAEEIVAGLMKVKDSYNVSRLSAASAEAAISDREYFAATVASVREQRQRLERELAGMGFTVFPSGANFLLARAPGGKAGAIYEKLLERKILVRYFKLRRLDDCLRISVGTEMEMTTLLDALRDILRS